MIRLGPAGNSERFYQEGFKKSEQAPAWLRGMGLSALEYSAGHGVSLSEATARAIGAEAAKNGVQMSIHAPYYINCCTDDPIKRPKNKRYLLEAARAIDWMGGVRVVFHVGVPDKKERAASFARAKDDIAEARQLIVDEGLSHIVLCPETMGRPGQLGTLEEILEICRMDDSFLPTLDFGHLHTIGLGALNSTEDFRRILDRVIEVLGFERAQSFHAHFSKIEYNAKGERMHKTFADEGYGPEFAHLAPLIAEYKLSPTIICESRGVQADDALIMRQLLVESGASVW